MPSLWARSSRSGKISHRLPAGANEEKVTELKAAADTVFITLCNKPVSNDTDDWKEHWEDLIISEKYRPIKDVITKTFI